MRFYFTINNQQVGPLEEDEIHTKIACGEINRSTFVWASGMPEWAPVGGNPKFMSSFPEVTQIPPPPPVVTPPPPPPGSQVSGTYATLGTRFVASLIDFGIVVCGSALLGSFLPALLVSGGIAAYWLLLMSEIGGGQTLGYRAMKLKLIGEDTGKPIPLSRAATWTGLFLLLGGIGWIWALNDQPKYRALYNLKSNTVVVPVG